MCSKRIRFEPTAGYECWVPVVDLLENLVIQPRQVLFPKCGLECFQHLSFCLLLFQRQVHLFTRFQSDWDFFEKPYVAPMGLAFFARMLGCFPLLPLRNCRLRSPLRTTNGICMNFSSQDGGLAYFSICVEAILQLWEDSSIPIEAKVNKLLNQKRFWNDVGT